MQETGVTRKESEHNCSAEPALTVRCHVENRLTCGPHPAGSGSRTRGNDSNNTWQPLSPKPGGSENQSFAVGHPRLSGPEQDRGFTDEKHCLDNQLICRVFL